MLTFTSNRAGASVIAKLAASVVVVLGLIALFDFDLITRHVLFLSGDGVIEPYSYLQLRIVLVSMGVAGICVLSSRMMRGRLTPIVNYLAGLSQTQFLAVTLFSAAILRLAALALLPVTLRSDSLAYHDFAVTLAQTGAFSELGAPTASWPPGYPWLLSRVYLLFGIHPLAGAVVNLLFSLGICAIAYLIARRIWNESVGRITGVILAIFPSQIFFLNLLVSEYLFSLLFWSAVYLVIRVEQTPKYRGPILFLAGCVLGLATLTRNLVLYFPVMLAPFWLLTGISLKKTLIRFALVVAGLSVAIVPWMLRNADKLGTSSLTTNGGVNFYIGNHPGSGIGWMELDTSVIRFHRPDLEAYNDSVGYALGRRYIQDHPLRFLAFGVGKLAYTFGEDLDPVVYGVLDAAAADRVDRYVLFAGMAQTAYLLLLLAAIPGIVRSCRKKPLLEHPGIAILLGAVVYWAAVHFVYFGSGRFHFPLIPAFAMMAAIYFLRADGDSTRPA